MGRTRVSRDMARSLATRRSRGRVGRVGERDRHEHGTFSWTDLSTPDADGSRDFYGPLLGWDFVDAPIPEEAGGGVYRMARIDGRAAAAMYETTERHPAWASYVTVDDADATAARAKELGANLMGEPFDVMTTGADGARPGPDRRGVRALAAARQHRGGGREPPRRALLQPAQHERPGRRAELLRGSVRLAVRAPRPAIRRTGASIAASAYNGGHLPLPPSAPMPSHWLVYFGIDDLDSASGQIASGGGTVMIEPREVPAGASSWPRTRRARSSRCSRAASTTDGRTLTRRSGVLRVCGVRGKWLDRGRAYRAGVVRLR